MTILAVLYPGIPVTPPRMERNSLEWRVCNGRDITAGMGRTTAEIETMDGCSMIGT